MSTKREKFEAEGMPLLNKLIDFCLKNQIGLRVDLPGDELVEVSTMSMSQVGALELLRLLGAAVPKPEADAPMAPKARGIN